MPCAICGLQGTTEADGRRGGRRGCACLPSTTRNTAGLYRTAVQGALYFYCSLHTLQATYRVPSTDEWTTWKLEPPGPALLKPRSVAVL
eukprot:7119097-Prymnesium_polylepis.2